jgi:hypothetical protein
MIFNLNRPPARVKYVPVVGERRPKFHLTSNVYYLKILDSSNVTKKRQTQGSRFMRKVIIASLAILAAGAALAGQVIVGGQGTAVNYPYCGS